MCRTSPWPAMRIANTAARAAHDRAVDGPQDLALGRPGQGPEDLHLDARRCAPRGRARPRRACTGSGCAGFDLERVDVDEVRLVDGVRPAEVAVVAVQDDRRAREEAADRVPARLAVQVGLVPRHRARPGLVGVDGEPREPVGRAARRDREGVRARGRGRRRRRWPPGSSSPRRTPIEAEEERCLVDEAGDQVLSARGVQVGHRLVRMERGVVVDAVRVGFAQRARLRREVPLVARLHDVRDPQELDHVVVGRAFTPEDGGQPSARREQRALDRLEIVLGVSPGQAVGDVGVGAAEDVRDAPGVAEDAHVVAALGQEGRGIHPPPRPDGKRQHGDGQEGRQEEGDPRGLSHRAAAGYPECGATSRDGGFFVATGRSARSSERCRPGRGRSGASSFP